MEQKKNHNVISNDDATANIPIIDSQDFYDIIVIGGGPNGLAVVSRILEERPSRLYTDAEHARLHWLKKYRNQQAIHTNRRGNKLSNNQQQNYNSKEHYYSQENGVQQRKQKILVIDDHGDKWMSQWNSFFKAYEITHLRSPMFFHPGPADLDGLIAFARTHGRENELMPISGVVGKELSKHKRKQQRYGNAKSNTARTSDVWIHERDRRDYYRPSTSLFWDFCQQEIIERYGIKDNVLHAKVLNLSTGPVHVRNEEIIRTGDDDNGGDGIIRVEINQNQSDTKKLLAASAVIIAIGSQGLPCIPKPLSIIGALHDSGFCHSSCLSWKNFKFPPEFLASRLKSQSSSTTVLIIGGGLTSAQIADLCVRRKFTKVILITRGHIKIKHFDFDLAWTGKYGNVLKMQFWQTDCLKERYELLQGARNGGSINPHHYAIIKKHMSNKKLDLMTMTEITRANWRNEDKKWSLTLSREVTQKGLKEKETETIMLDDVDYIISATGGKMGIKDHPFLQSILKSHPIEDVEGLPVLGNPHDLQWAHNLPLYVVGPYASLELGPAGPNLGGAREGAERVANCLLQKWSGGHDRQHNITYTGYWSLASDGEDEEETD